MGCEGGKHRFKVRIASTLYGVERLPCYQLAVNTLALLQFVECRVRSTL